MRQLLSCPRDSNLPCHGYMGSCVALRETYYRFAAPALLTVDRTVHHVDPHACHAFPDPDSQVHTIVAGLISFAVCLPCAQLAASCFSLATATDDAQLHGRTRLMRWSLGRSVALLGRAPWRHGGGALHRLRRRVASSWCTTAWDDGLVRLGALAEWMAARLRRARGLPAPAATHDARTAAFATAGYCCIAICWASFVWTILVYGKRAFPSHRSVVCALVRLLTAASYPFRLGSHIRPPGRAGGRCLHAQLGHQRRLCAGAGRARRRDLHRRVSGHAARTRSAMAPATRCLDGAHAG